MFCNFCGVSIPNGGKFCPQCGKSQVVVENPPKKKINVWLVLAGVFVLVLAVAIGSESDQQTAQDKSQAIAAIQQRYAPSDRLMILNPGDDGYWDAFQNPVECTYGHDERKRCWKVWFRVTVMPQAESKSIKCEWLINLDTMQVQATNVEAQTMFVRN
jgi:predicted nucleic acid-binding Zn ribbon protein